MIDHQKYYASYPPPFGAGMQPPQPIVTAPPPQPDAPTSPPGGWSPPNMTYPPGLEYLMDLDYLFVNQSIELLQAFTGWETKNKYVISNSRGEPVFYMVEDSGICWRLCMGKYRSCEFSIYDKHQREVLHMIRPYRCTGCCCPCCLQVLEVYSGNVLLGSVTEEWSLWRPKFYIRDASGQPVLMIKGPLLRFCIDVIFKVKSIDQKHRVGTIQKQWSGFAREMFTVSDKFGINFPRDLDVKIKAVLLGACILIDFMYFEWRN
ncbi:PREDICTED: phospholipid scramblase 1-like isoform X1 [Cyphomyrmex costatus]|uniref:phospholipid scramblase 1-like isoform X1 n=2 Tax=Cyphomyrmex costatus TaxID=456900 RepID=UPI00085232AA|nr:PREDICTED: phospholipid scramblase 1-like isoform X1 [Cyphomyrmex costatus]XP_018400792.1 PREDICTED: phospholipid scramblase 1-like isoform X1 [Cyphomyrmex costatus]XP_018400793.1 PREDICTED: phospholipid scramblase 1-like isoform X1 [Cyphomyrmex costatus]XP_018400794.1 PREDICTED: phospholipid scramblase 1-like isoform X1 [Cyphomyrmex costatus]